MEIYKVIQFRNVTGNPTPRSLMYRYAEKMPGQARFHDIDYMACLVCQNKRYVYDHWEITKGNHGDDIRLYLREVEW